MTTPTTPIDAQMLPISNYEREFLHDNPNTDDVVDWIHTYAQAHAAQQCAELEARLAVAMAAIQVYDDAMKNIAKQADDLVKELMPAHDSDCSVHNMPAAPAGPCDCRLAALHTQPTSAVVQEPVGDLLITNGKFNGFGYRSSCALTDGEYVVFTHPIKVEPTAQPDREVQSDLAHSIEVDGYTQAQKQFLSSIVLRIAATPPPVVKAEPTARPILGYRYSRNNGKTWHLCESDPAGLMPDKGGIVIALVNATTPPPVAGDASKPTAQPLVGCKIFEAWCIQNAIDTTLNQSKEFYWYAESEAAWRGWQGALASLATPPPVAGDVVTIPAKLPPQAREVLIDRFTKAAKGACFLYDDIWNDLLRAATTSKQEGGK